MRRQGINLSTFDFYCTFLPVFLKEPKGSYRPAVWAAWLLAVSDTRVYFKYLPYTFPIPYTSHLPVYNTKFKFKNLFTVFNQMLIEQLYHLCVRFFLGLFQIPRHPQETVKAQSWLGTFLQEMMSPSPSYFRKLFPAVLTTSFVLEEDCWRSNHPMPEAILALCKEPGTAAGSWLTNITTP